MLKWTSPRLTKGVRVWQRAERSLSRGAVRLQEVQREDLPSGQDATAGNSVAAETHEEQKRPQADAKPKIIRKLMVGLGNPGKQFELTRHNIGQQVLDHFVSSYATKVMGKQLAFHEDKSLHGKVTYFHLPFQQNSSHKSFVYPHDDLIDAMSDRRKQKTMANGVPHDCVNVAVLQPTTFMNCSGHAVKLFMQKHRWRLKRNPSALNFQDELLVVSDDVASPFGTCRFRVKGGSGGQNGVRDIIKSTGTERFARLKIGVGAPQWFVNNQTGAPAGFDMARYVLGRFNGEEQDHLNALLAFTTELLRLYVHRGVNEASTFANGTTLHDWLKTRKRH